MAPIPKNAEYFLGRIASADPDAVIALSRIIDKYRAVAEAGRRLRADKNNVHAWAAMFDGLDALEADP